MYNDYVYAVTNVNKRFCITQRICKLTNNIDEYLIRNIRNIFHICDDETKVIKTFYFLYATLILLKLHMHLKKQQYSDFYLISLIIYEILFCIIYNKQMNSESLRQRCVLL